MNKVELVGRLVRDPDVKAGSTTVARFTVAAQRTFKDKDGNYGADFINCVAFGKTAEILEKYFSKGSQIGVIGRINTGSFTNKDGNTVYTTDVAVESVEFVGSKADNSASTQQAKKESKPASGGDDFISIPDCVDDLPFIQQ